MGAFFDVFFTVTIVWHIRVEQCTVLLISFLLLAKPCRSMHHFVVSCADRLPFASVIIPSQWMPPFGHIYKTNCDTAENKGYNL
jgi:hypothetical protein